MTNSHFSDKEAEVQALSSPRGVARLSGSGGPESSQHLWPLPLEGAPSHWGLLLPGPVSYKASKSKQPTSFVKYFKI